MTSQSKAIVRSPSAARSTTERSERPMSRWISCVRPDWRPWQASRGVRVEVALGKSAYSALIHPVPVPRRKYGTRFSTDAAHITRVRPISMSTDPAGPFWKPRVIFKGRSASAARLRILCIAHVPLLSREKGRAPSPAPLYPS